MSSLLPIRSEPSTGGQEPRVVDLEGEDAEQVFSALSSTTARRIVAKLHEEPRTQSDIAEELDTTVQNVRYHLDKLEDAGLVEVVDTWYSSRGNEMQVYAPADGALIVSGDEGTASRLRSALSRLIGGVAVLGLASLFVQTLVQRFGRLGGAAGGEGFVDRGGDDGGAVTNQTDQDYELSTTVEEGVEATDGNTATQAPEATRTATEADQARTATTTATDAPMETATPTATATPKPTQSPTATATATPTSTATATPTATSTPTSTATQAPTETTEAARTTVETTKDAVVNGTTTVDPTRAADAAPDPGGLPPGVLFFMGGVTVLVALTAVWYFSGR